MIPVPEFHAHAQVDVEAEDCCKSSCWNFLNCCPTIFPKSPSDPPEKYEHDENYYRHKYKRIKKLMLENITISDSKEHKTP